MAGQLAAIEVGDEVNGESRREMTIRILYVGETWRGSSARSMREALEAQPGVVLDDVGEDHYLPKHRTKFLRGFNRLLRTWQVRDLEYEIFAKLHAVRPDILMVYKGNGVGADLVRRAKAEGIATVNVFPDYSPHAYGPVLRDAIGEYDLVVSTKPFHPAGWRPTYGYTNRCVCVPHGYDPAVHYWDRPAERQDLDVVLAASWRTQYHELVLALARRFSNSPVKVGLAGAGWKERAGELPAEWEIAGPLHGRAYGEWLRRGKIAIAPVHREVVIKGVRQPGDEDTTRTYELAAAHCFFLHRRTEYVRTVYDERTEVPMWDSPEELARLIDHYLPRESERRAMARAAHARAVPAYSIPGRAAQVLTHVSALFGRKGEQAF